MPTLGANPVPEKKGAAKKEAARAAAAAQATEAAAREAVGKANFVAALARSEEGGVVGEDDERPNEDGVKPALQVSLSGLARVPSPPLHEAVFAVLLALRTKCPRLSLLHVALPGQPPSSSPPPRTPPPPPPSPAASAAEKSEGVEEDKQRRLQARVADLTWRNEQRLFKEIR